jgi:serine/threonine protein phosphatase PrpC
MRAVAVVLCPACGEQASASDRFCEACGEELGGGPGGPGTGLDGASGGPGPAASQPSCGSCGTEDPWLDGYCSVCGAKEPDLRDHLEAALDGLGAVTDRGRRHSRNEDAMAVGLGAGWLAAVVCDGVSQSQRPQDASQAAADAALAELLASPPGPAQMLAAYSAAREAVLSLPYDEGADLGPPSCTYLAATVAGSHVVLAALGDCRAYWVGDGGPLQLTADHGWAAEAVAAGMPVDEARSDARAHAVTRWLAADADPTWQPDLAAFDAPGPGLLLLASDGLWNYAPEPAELAAVITGAGDPRDADYPAGDPRAADYPAGDPRAADYPAGDPGAGGPKAGAGPLAAEPVAAEPVAAEPVANGAAANVPGARVTDAGPHALGGPDAGPVAPGESPLDLARRLVAFALSSGGSDNITVAVVSVPAAAPAPTATAPAPAPTDSEGPVPT